MGHAHQPFGLQFNGDHSKVSVYRKISANADQSSVTTTNTQFYYDSANQSFSIKTRASNGSIDGSLAMDLYRLTWSTAELGETIGDMLSYTTGNGSGIQKEIYQAFLDCLEESMSMYLNYNVACSPEDFETCATKQSELDAQVTRLLSYKEILKPDFSAVLASLPTPYNELYDGPLTKYHNMDFRSVRGMTFYIVHLDPNGNGSTGWALCAEDGLYVQDSTNRLYGEPVTVIGDRVVDASTAAAFLLKENRTSTALYKNEFSTWPVYNRTFAVNNGDILSNNSNHYICGYHAGGQVAFVPTLTNEGMTLHCNRNYDGVGTSNDHYFLTYIPEAEGFRPMMREALGDVTLDLFRLYRISSHVLDLYRAIMQVAVYATGNQDNRYPTALYAEFLSCLTESIRLYQHYNTEFEVNWDEDALKESLGKQTSFLPMWMP